MMDDISSNLSNNLRQLREMRGLSQQQLARQAGIPRPTWASLESGSANPTLSVLVKVATSDNSEKKDIYPCPVYMTQSRGPTFVFTAGLRTKAGYATKWILAGVSMLMDVVES